MPWTRKRLKNGKIWAETDESGALVVNERGLVQYRYKQDDERTYTAQADKVRDIDGAVPQTVAPPPPSAAPPGGGGGGASPDQPGPLRVSAINNPSPVDQLEPAPADHIEIYTDGACTGNPGPAGLGVVLRFGPWHREIYQYLGMATNNIAELTAIKVALEAVRDPARKIRLHTDSQYAIGVLTGRYKVKANRALIHDIQRVMKRFTDLDLIHVRGHAGIPLNERVDELARLAIAEGTGATPVEAPENN